MPQSATEGTTDEESQALLNNGEIVGERNRFWFFLIWFWRFCIFGMTGSSSVVVTRFIIQHAFGTDALATGTYYLVFFILEMVVYTAMLLIIGTCLGQHKFFSMVATRMWSWLIPHNWALS